MKITPLKITPYIFEAFLKCPTKCWLRANNEPPNGNTYAEWVETQNESFRVIETGRLRAEIPPTDYVFSPSTKSLKAAKWSLAVDIAVTAPNLPSSSQRQELPSEYRMTNAERRMKSESLVISAATVSQSTICHPPATIESRLHSAERVPSEGRGKAAQFSPIRFIFSNKLGKVDKLLLAFDAFVLAAALGCDIAVGKIIHGDDHATLKVKTSALTGEVRKHLENITALLSSPTPPDLVLNRHCAACEFHTRCRQKALEQDDLSLLAGMSTKERAQHRRKGIFTVNQLAYTFRARRRPKRLRDKREKYHHSLKALAIREKKIHIVGSPEMKIEGTPVYLDVEGLPDRDFYYLIGVRIGNDASTVQHSLWADTVKDEGKIWWEFLSILETVEKPVLIYYGNYETTFLKNMCERYGQPPEGSAVLQQAIKAPLNLLSVIFAQIYFPTLSNSLKDIASFLGCRWSDLEASGTSAIVWRDTWEQINDPKLKERLRVYNSDDCMNLQKLAQALSGLSTIASGDTGKQSTDIVRTDTMKRPQRFRWGQGEYSVQEFQSINDASYWDYQRERIYLRTDLRKRSLTSPNRRPTSGAWDRIVDIGSPPVACAQCSNTLFRKSRFRQKVVHDLHFQKKGIVRRVTRFRSFHHTCARCGIKVAAPDNALPHDKYGAGLMAYLIYHLVEIFVPQEAMVKMLNDLFDLRLRGSGQINPIKARAAEFYRPTYDQILYRISHGRLLHVDETKANIQGCRTYVWVFTTLDEVAYVHSETRESDLPRKILSEFKGILISDFYSAYEAINCRQQKCLIHLLRDMNTDLLNAPFSGELRYMAEGFGFLLRKILQTIDRFGLKARFLRKHKAEAADFLKSMIMTKYESAAALKYQKRLNRHQDALFAFLDFDGVPWNNNNAEHAVKAFARLRNVIRGTSTEKGIRDYLVLLSISQTCKYMGVDFQDFLRSGEKDILSFAESRRRRRHLSSTSEPKASPTDDSAEKRAFRHRLHRKAAFTRCWIHPAFAATFARLYNRSKERCPSEGLYESPYTGVNI